MQEKLTYEFLYQYYLEDQVEGKMESVNKYYFPKEYIKMQKELDDLKRSNNDIYQASGFFKS